MKSFNSRRPVSISRCVQALTLVVFLTLSYMPLVAQLDQGVIGGVVQDKTGAMVPGAQVTLTDMDTGITFQDRTNASGIYVFPSTKIGNYKLTASSSGFRTLTQENIHLDAGDRLNILLVLQPGQVSQTVTVSTAPPLLQTQDASVGQVMSSQFINDAPLANRNWVYIAQQAAGVVPSQSTRGGGSGDFEVNGQHAEQNNFILDGIDDNVDVNDYINGASYNIAPPPDALSEFKLETSNMSAEVGHGHSSVLNVAIKSGTNAIHGDVWEYFRNTNLDAVVWNYNPLQPVPPFHLNQFGATLGFPILKNKLFYFGDIQDSRYSFSTPGTFSVPTPLERQGNFTELLNPTLTGNACPTVLYVPNSNTGTYPTSTCKTIAPTGTLQRYGNSQIGIFAPGQNVFNPGTLDPVALKILNMYPSPNAAGWNSSNNSNTSTAQGQTYNNLVENLGEVSNPIQWDQRLDWNISSKDQAYAVYDYQHLINILQSPLGPILDGYTNNAGHTQSYLSELFMISETHLFTPTLINEFRFGFNWGKFSNLQYNYNVNEAANLGLGGMPFNAGPKNGGLPPVSISSIQAFGSHGNDPSIEGQNIWELLDNVTKTIGNHSLKAGVEFLPIRWYGTAVGASRGSYGFTGQFTSVTGVSNTGNGVADFIAQGYNSTGGLTGTDSLQAASISNYELNNYEQAYDAAYVQDNWRATPTLTLDFGIRYEYFQPHKEMAGAWANWVPLTMGLGANGGFGTAAFVLPSVNQKTPLSPAILQLLNYDDVQVQYDNNPRLVSFPKANWAPRFGLAYQLDGKTVVRSGIGLYYGLLEPGGGSSLTQNIPFVISSNLTLPGCSAGTYCASLQAQGATLENGLTPFLNQGIAAFISYPSIQTEDPVVHTPYTLNYNLSVQRALSNSMSLTVGYVGNGGRHLVTLLGGPSLPQGITVSGVNTKTLQSAPQFSTAQWMTWRGASNYNSLQATLQKRYSGGLTFLTTYTWAHTLDDTIDLLGGDVSGYRMPYLLPASTEYTNSNYDVRQRLNVNGDYDLPFGRGRQFANRSGLLNNVVGGWKINLTYIAQTGEPFTVGTANFTAAAGPSRVGPVEIGNPFAAGGTSPSPTATTSGNTSATCFPKVRTRNNWYNPCAFTNPLGSTNVAANATGTYSYSSPQLGQEPPLTAKNEPYINTAAGVTPFLGGLQNLVEGPGYWRVNSSLFKDFPVWREQFLEFRADAFNLLNHPTWANPSTTGDNGSTAGLITAPINFQNNTIDARFFQLSAKYVF